MPSRRNLLHRHGRGNAAESWVARVGQPQDIASAAFSEPLPAPGRSFLRCPLPLREARKCRLPSSSASPISIHPKPSRRACASARRSWSGISAASPAAMSGSRPTI
jgi:hypothetical protein